MNRNRAAALLAPLIVLLLAVGGFLLLRADGQSGPDDGDAGNEVVEGPTTTPSEIATDAVTGGADGAGGTPSPTPSEVGEDAAAGGGAGAGAVGGEGEEDGEAEDPTVDDDDTTGGADDNGGDGSTGDDDGSTGDDERDVAGDFGTDTEDADDDGALPETGSAGMLAGLVLMLLGVSLRPRR